MKTTTLKLVSFFAFAIAGLTTGCAEETRPDAPVAVEADPGTMPIPGGRGASETSTAIAGDEAEERFHALAAGDVARHRGIDVLNGVEPSPPNPCPDLMPSH